MSQTQNALSPNPHSDIIMISYRYDQQPSTRVEETIIKGLFISAIAVLKRRRIIHQSTRRQKGWHRFSSEKTTKLRIVFCHKTRPNDGSTGCETLLSQ